MISGNNCCICQFEVSFKKKKKKGLLRNRLEQHSFSLVHFLLILLTPRINKFLSLTLLYCCPGLILASVEMTNVRVKSEMKLCWVSSLKRLTWFSHLLLPADHCLIFHSLNPAFLQYIKIGVYFCNPVVLQIYLFQNIYDNLHIR